MATRSAIGIKHGSVIKAVYCHWDGYVEYNGRVLDHFYRDSVKVNNLVALGDLSSLGAEIGTEHDFGGRWTDDQYVPVGDSGFVVAPECTYYSRDRGEDAPFRTFQTEEDFLDHYDHMGAECYYLYDHGVWYVSQNYQNNFKPLHEVLSREMDHA